MKYWCDILVLEV